MTWVFGGATCLKNGRRIVWKQSLFLRFPLVTLVAGKFQTSPLKDVSVWFFWMYMSILIIVSPPQKKLSVFFPCSVGSSLLWYTVLVLINGLSFSRSVSLSFVHSFWEVFCQKCVFNQGCVLLGYVNVEHCFPNPVGPLQSQRIANFGPMLARVQAADILMH